MSTETIRLIRDGLVVKGNACLYVGYMDNYRECITTV